MVSLKTFFKGGIRKKVETLDNLAHIYACKVKSYLLLPHIRNRFHQSKEYKDYLVAQMTKSTRIARKSKPQRAVDLTTKIGELVPEHGNKSVLCIGCRNAYELDLFEEEGFSPVQGIDLFSVDPRITVMDMHCLEYDDNSFDVIYSCHSLEHSYDHKVVIDQMLRTLKPGGVVAIEIPVDYQTTKVDLFDFGSVENLIAAFEPHVDTVLFSEQEYKEDTKENLARVVLKMK